MSSRNVFLSIAAVMLLLVSSMGRQGASPPTPEPLPAGEGSAAAIATRNAYRAEISVGTRAFADRVEAMEFEDEVTEAKAYASIAGGIAKSSSEGTTKAFAAMYKAAREMTADDAVKAKARADWYRDFAKGWEVR